jgi:hypothetical protein
MILALAVVVGLIISVVRYRGQAASQIAGISLRWGWLAIAALALQVPLLRAPSGTVEQVLAEKYLFLLSHLLLLAFVWRNRRIEAIQVVGIGILWNLAAIAANGGLMPISPATLARINPGTTPDQWMISQHYAYSKNVILYRESANLWLLSDVIVLPAPFPWPVAFSLGDLFIAVGVMVLLQDPPTQRAAQPGWTFRENAKLRALPPEGWQEEAKIHES